MAGKQWPWLTDWTVQCLKYMQGSSSQCAIEARLSQIEDADKGRGCDNGKPRR